MFLMLQEAEEAAANKAQAAQQSSEVVKSPGSSCLSYELFVGQPKGNDDNGRENMSIRSEGGNSISENRGRISGANGSSVRKVSAVSINNVTLYLLGSVL
jgi:voltage-gated sodium channel type II alpha